MQPPAELPGPESSTQEDSPKLLRVLWLGLQAAALISCAAACWPPLQRLLWPPPLDPAFIALSPAEIFALPLATRLQWPMGSENGALTYNAQRFRLNRHLGADLNGIGGGDSDWGDPVHAAGFGQVVFAREAGPGWGKMVILAHRIGGQDSLRVIQTVYAHLRDIHVQVGQVLQRGERLGSVGNADGRYLAHLHFEIREGAFINPGVGYADSTLNRLDPEALLGQLGPDPAELLHPAPGKP